MKKLDKLRNEIDKIDEELIELLTKRRSLSSEIINLKIKEGLPVFDPERENDIIRKLKQKYGEDIDAELIERIYSEILENSKLQFVKNKKASEAIQFELLRKPFFIAGPCVVETKEQIEEIAMALSAKGVRFLRGGTYKPRTSRESFQGLGEEGVFLLKEIADKYGMFTVSEVLDAEELKRHYDLIDVIQVGSRNMASYGLLKKIAKMTAYDQKPVILKRGFSATITEFLAAAEYIQADGNNNVLLCLRGIRTFEQNEKGMRNTPDLASILQIKNLSKLPVIFDPSHATGRSEYVHDVAKAAISLGADGLMIEVHNKPDEALSDGEQSINLKQFSDLWDELCAPSL